MGIYLLCAKKVKNLDYADGAGDTPLALACLGGHTECARVLLEGGALVNVINELGATPLMHACQCGHHECVQLCLAYDAIVDMPSRPGGLTPLFLATTGGHDECTSLILAAIERERLCGDREQVPSVPTESGGSS